MRPSLMCGLSLSERIRRSCPSVPSAILADELGTTVSNVSVVRSKAKRQKSYREKERHRQEMYRKKYALERPWVWACEYVEQFQTDA